MSHGNKYNFYTDHMILHIISVETTLAHVSGLLKSDLALEVICILFAIEINLSNIGPNFNRPALFAIYGIGDGTERYDF